MKAHAAPIAGKPIRVFSNHGFRLFWVASFFTMTSFFMIITARGWLILELTDSAFMVTAVQAISIFPILLALIGGVIADRLNKRVILITCDGTNVLFVFALGMLVMMGIVQTWQIFALALLSGISFSLSLPSRIALVADLVAAEDLPSAAALYISIFSTALLVGPAIGGVVIDAYGMSTALFLGTSLILPAILLLLLLLRVRVSPATKETTQSLKSSVLRDITEGIRYALNDKVLRVMLILGVVTSLIVQPYQSILPLFARDVLNMGADGLGALLAAVGLGAIPGSITVAFFNNPRQLRLMIAGGGIAIGIAIILFSFSTIFLISVALSFILGYLAQIVITSSFTVIQILSPNHIRGRVTSLRLVGHGATPIGMLLLGIGAEYTSPIYATASMGVIGLVALTCIALALPNLHRPQLAYGNNATNPTL